MTQPAKVQEPSMEEILASIRRIIADDDAKPAAAGNAAPAAAPKPAAPAAAKPAPAKTSGIPPSAVTPKPAAPPAPPPAATNSQDDIDAMLASLDEATTEAEVRPSQPEDV
ncbi:MAG TPA: DUF2497 domain-containing protein, partial [Nitrobacter sp.]|nr:DUF2497 domain-containing protein [Nitrobacter sp.]